MFKYTTKGHGKAFFFPRDNQNTKLKFHNSFLICFELSLFCSRCLDKSQLFSSSHFFQGNLKSSNLKNLLQRYSSSLPYISLCHISLQAAAKCSTLFPLQGKQLQQLLSLQNWETAAVSASLRERWHVIKYFSLKN